MFADVLQRQVSDGKLTLRQIAHAWMIAEHSVYPYLAGRDPKIDQFCRLLESAPVETQRVLMNFVLEFAPGWVAMHLPENLDINGDGDINFDDLMKGVIEQAAETTSDAAKLYKEGQKRRLNLAELDDQCAFADKAIQAWTRHKQIAQEIKRMHRPAKPVDAIVMAVGGAR